MKCIGMQGKRIIRYNSQNVFIFKDLVLLTSLVYAVCVHERAYHVLEEARRECHVSCSWSYSWL